MTSTPMSTALSVRTDYSTLEWLLYYMPRFSGVGKWLWTFVQTDAFGVWAQQNLPAWMSGVLSFSLTVYGIDKIRQVVNFTVATNSTNSTPVRNIANVMATLHARVPDNATITGTTLTQAPFVRLPTGINASQTSEKFINMINSMFTSATPNESTNFHQNVDFIDQIFGAQNNPPTVPTWYAEYIDLFSKSFEESVKYVNVFLAVAWSALYFLWNVQCMIQMVHFYGRLARLSAATVRRVFSYVVYQSPAQQQQQQALQQQALLQQNFAPPRAQDLRTIALTTSIINSFRVLVNALEQQGGAPQNASTLADFVDYWTAIMKEVFTPASAEAHLLDANFTSLRQLVHAVDQLPVLVDPRFAQRRRELRHLLILINVVKNSDQLDLYKQVTIGELLGGEGVHTQALFYGSFRPTSTLNELWIEAVLNVRDRILTTAGGGGAQPPPALVVPLNNIVVRTRPWMVGEQPAAFFTRVWRSLTSVISNTRQNFGRVLLTSITAIVVNFVAGELFSLIMPRYMYYLFVLVGFTQTFIADDSRVRAIAALNILWSWLARRTTPLAGGAIFRGWNYRDVGDLTRQPFVWYGVHDSLRWVWSLASGRGGGAVGEAGRSLAQRLYETLRTLATSYGLDQPTTAAAVIMLIVEVVFRLAGVFAPGDLVTYFIKMVGSFGLDLGKFALSLVSFSWSITTFTFAWVAGLFKGAFWKVFGSAPPAPPLTPIEKLELQQSKLVDMLKSIPDTNAKLASAVDANVTRLVDKMVDSNVNANLQQTLDKLSANLSQQPADMDKLLNAYAQTAEDAARRAVASIPPPITAEASDALEFFGKFLAGVRTIYASIMDFLKSEEFANFVALFVTLIIVVFVFVLIVRRVRAYFATTPSEPSDMDKNFVLIDALGKGPLPDSLLTSSSSSPTEQVLPKPAPSHKRTASPLAKQQSRTTRRRRR